MITKTYGAIAMWQALSKPYIDIYIYDSNIYGSNVTLYDFILGYDFKGPQPRSSEIQVYPVDSGDCRQRFRKMGK